MQNPRKIRAALASLLLVAAVALYGASATASPPADPAFGSFAAFDIPASSATPIITGSLTPSAQYPVVAYAITIALDGTNSVVNWTVSDGTTTYKSALNSGTALTAGNVYTFLVGATRTIGNNSSATMDYDIECATTTHIRHIQVDEVRSDAR